MKALLIGLLVTGAIALTLACGGTADTDTGARAETTLSPQAEPCGLLSEALTGCDPHDYPPSVIQNFMDSCTATGASQGDCSCAITKIQKRYTLSSFIDIEQAYNATGIMDGNLTSIMAACRSY